MLIGICDRICDSGHGQQPHEMWEVGQVINSIAYVCEKCKEESERELRSAS